MPLVAGQALVKRGGGQHGVAYHHLESGLLGPARLPGRCGPPGVDAVAVVGGEVEGEGGVTRAARQFVTAGPPVVEEGTGGGPIPAVVIAALPGAGDAERGARIVDNQKGARGLRAGKACKAIAHADGLPIARAVQHGQALAERPPKDVGRVFGDLHAVQPNRAHGRADGKAQPTVTGCDCSLEGHAVLCPLRGQRHLTPQAVVGPVVHLLLQTNRDRLAGRALGPEHHIVALTLADRDVVLADRDVPIHALAGVADVGAQGLPAFSHVGGF